MLKKIAIILVISITIGAFSNIAWSSVEGTWDIQGKQTVKFSVKGYGSQTQKKTFSDEFTFDDDGQFEMTAMDGTWSQTGKKFTTYLDPASVIQYIEDSISAELYSNNISVEVTKMTFGGKEQKNGTIKGTYKLYISFYIEDYDLTGKITVSGSFKGTPRQFYTTSIVEKESSDMSESIFETIGEEISDTAQAFE